MGLRQAIAFIFVFAISELGLAGDGVFVPESVAQEIRKWFDSTGVPSDTMVTWGKMGFDENNPLTRLVEAIEAVNPGVGRTPCFAAAGCVLEKDLGNDPLTNIIDMSRTVEPVDGGHVVKEAEIYDEGKNISNMQRNIENGAGVIQATEATTVSRRSPEFNVSGKEIGTIDPDKTKVFDVNGNQIPTDEVLRRNLEQFGASVEQHMKDDFLPEVSETLGEKLGLGEGVPPDQTALNAAENKIDSSKSSTTGKRAGLKSCIPPVSPMGVATAAVLAFGEPAAETILENSPTQVQNAAAAGAEFVAEGMESARQAELAQIDFARRVNANGGLMTSPGYLTAMDPIQEYVQPVVEGFAGGVASVFSTTQSGYVGMVNGVTGFGDPTSQHSYSDWGLTSVFQTGASIVNHIPSFGGF